eukprot:TRINITY_DN2763_c0_g1_i1.p1 TRINITY_DN2763_c0_g1~~TRINITY_DN2763_c0_g1_i1.p1  ORF type:complete len:338 (-),score=49.99 TRINITY_DN2763_c0_g1_i1:47-1060(-)
MMLVTRFYYTPDWVFEVMVGGIPQTLSTSSFFLGRVEVTLILCGGQFEKYGLLYLHKELGTAISEKEIKCNGLEYICLEPGQRWQLKFTGKLTSQKSHERVPVQFDFVWETDSAIFHSGTDMDPWAVAKAMSVMEWSRDYFKNLKSENQTRIESGGRLSGQLIVNNRKERVNWRGIRDHSWGRRNYKFINRFIQSMICLDSPCVMWKGGPLISYLSWIVVDYGSSFRCLVTGWLSGPNITQVIPLVEGTDIALVGSDGNIPTYYCVYFRPQGAPLFKMSVTTSDNKYSWFMENNNHEECDFLTWVTIFGEGGMSVSGQGLTGFGYRKRLEWGHRFPS